MTTAHDTVRGPAFYAWLAAVALIVALTYGSCGQMLAFMYLTPGAAGDTGATFVRDGGQPTQSVIVQGLRPGSVLAAAGVRPGDRVRLDHPWDDLRMPKAGETFGLTKLGRTPQHVSVTLPAAPPMPEGGKLGAALTPLANMTIALIGLFVVIRSRGDLAAMLLGTGFALVGPIPPYVWPIPASHVPFWQVPVWLGIDLLPLFLLGFAMSYVEKTTGALPAWQKALFRAVIVVQLAASAWEITDTLLNLNLPLIGFVRPLNYVVQIVCLVLPAFVFAVGWLKSTAEMRTRFTLMFIALPITFLAQSVYVVATLVGGGLVDLSSPFAVAAGLGIFVGPLLFIYAVFRHKVLNIGFAINRALVYGVVSAVLLLVFGLVEWAVERFLPMREHLEANILLNAGVALGIFLVFHRVRDFVENLVEKLLFSSWHHNEAWLRRFVRQASFIGKADALTSAFIAELQRFSGGAEVALCLADGADFASGKARIDGDDPAVIAMKADHAPVEAADHLDLPMIHRAELTGFVRLGLKPSGETYRPDEREVLAWAAHQIGLDLYALKVEALEARVATLDAQLAYAASAGLAKAPARGQGRGTKDKTRGTTA